MTILILVAQRGDNKFHSKEVKLSGLLMW